MKSIQTKITVTYLGLALLVLASVGVLSSSRVESYFKQRLVDNLARHTDVISYLLQSDSLLSFAEIHQAIQRISGIENLRITLVDKDGGVLADSDVPLDRIASVENHLQRPELQQALVKEYGSDTRHSATVGLDFLYVAKSLRDPLNQKGLPALKFVRLSMPLEAVQADINNIRMNIVFAGLLVLALVTGISLVVSRRISKPMADIAVGLERIRAGNLGEHLTISSNDEIGRVAGAVNELVEKLKADIAQLAKLERVRSEFLGNVSHELRTPIFAIQGFLETLLNGAVNDPKVNRSFLEKAQSNAHRLNALLTDLINISQIESGEMKMSFRYFRVNEFLESTVKDFHPAAGKLGLNLRLELNTDNSVEVYGDRERMQQVMSNLIENALRYNKEGGEVRIFSTLNDGSVEVGVADTGVGIASEHLPRIFERFYRVDKNRSREVGGTGLGLAIVKHIIEAHDSSVEVESEVGRGTTFRFVLRKG